MQILNSKRSVNVTSRRVYSLIKQHNELCLMLKRFNDFWKYLLVPLLTFNIIFIWFILYVILVYPKADKLAKLFFWSLFIQMLSIFAGIVIIMFNVSSEVILFTMNNYNFIILYKFCCRRNLFIQF